MQRSFPQLLVEKLLENNVISKEDLPLLTQQATEQEKSLEELLVQQKKISDRDLLEIKSKLYHLPIFDSGIVNPDKLIIENIPEHIINRYNIVPFERSEGVLKVALINPEDIDALEALKFLASEQQTRLQKYLISIEDFKALSKGVRSFSTEIDKALQSIGDDVGSDMKKDEEVELLEDKSNETQNITAEGPVTRVVASIVRYAVNADASDIHIEPEKKEIRVRFRVDGVLQTMLTLPIDLLPPLVTRIKILSDLKIDETRLAQDGRFATKIGDRSFDFRVSTFPTRDGEKVVLRILDPMAGAITLEDLGVNGRSLNLIKTNIDKPFGAILITGPTGSGKSTTLAAILRLKNSDEINIVTLEDPIEYYVEGVNQSQIHEEIGYTFAAGLRHILRQDPDVIMVGEIRDEETSKLTTHASLTGHVVLSTLHTNDTIGVIPRLIDMGVEKYLIAPMLNLSVAQRLLRRLCQTCKSKAQLTESQKKIISQTLLDMPEYAKEGIAMDFSQVAMAGAGCKECNMKAYKGRIGIFETLEMTDELERIILSDISEERLRGEAKRQGMITMFQDGVLKVLMGMTSMEELIQVAQADKVAVAVELINSDKSIKIKQEVN